MKWIAAKINTALFLCLHLYTLTVIVLCCARDGEGDDDDDDVHDNSYSTLNPP